MALRVGVPPIVVGQPGTTSFGRLWRHGLDGLRASGVDVVVSDPRRRFRRPRVDVWLTDGHQGPIDVDRPVVAHLHEAAWTEPALRATFEPSFLQATEQASAAAAAAAARLLTVSESSRRQIVESYGLDPGAVDVAHNGVDHGVYRPGLVPSAPVRRPYVLFVSTVHPRKNLDALRNGLTELARERSHQLGLVLVAGPAADRTDSTELQEAAVAPIAGVDAPVLNLVGSTDAEVAALMGSAATFCLPSLMEGFGMAVAEAMACGAPCVVSDRGSLPEVVGDAGVVVEPTAAGVAGGLATVLDDAGFAAELSTRAAERARRFTWEAMVTTWLACLRAVA